ncbi:MAG: (d)CMP kinase, partial [Candidatus Marinimicrobia bacterium]|nr:(d)CMP kinase [Candidatus Neomarinimicrobiota bacterium]
MIIAIDGPAGSGKSTTAHRVAEYFNWAYVDTGAMYRAIAYGTMQNGIDPSDEAAVTAAADGMQISISGSGENFRIKLNDEDISEAIRSLEVTERVSTIAAIAEVRKLMVKKQRSIGEIGNCVIDGRDIGTVVFPQAEYKFYVDAAIEERARRRQEEFQAQNPDITLEEIIESIRDRDDKDMNRKVSPLRKAEDALLIDTTNITIDEQVKIIINVVNNGTGKTNLPVESNKGESMTEEVKEAKNPQGSVLEAYKNSTDSILSEIRVMEQTALDLEDTGGEEVAAQLAMYEKTLNKFDQEDCVVGHIIRVAEKEVVVDIGFKSEGVIPIEEFGRSLPEIGGQIEVYVDRIEDEHGQLILSKRKADFLKAWKNIREVYEENRIIEGNILKRIKGGMVVDILGVDGFLPGSQIDVRPITDFDSYVGKAMDFKIVKLNESRKNIVVSHKEILEESLKEKREELLSQIQVDQVLKGRVKNITDFGVFVDLGGVDGLLHITDMSWGKINHPSEMVKIDEVIEVKVIDYDTEKQRVSLGMKQLTANPWDDIEVRYPVHSVVKGRIVSITNYGLFIELEKGVEGLIHISELSWTANVKHPSEAFSINDIVDAKVLAIDINERKISLGVKQLLPDPWDEIEETLSPESVIKGTVRNLKQYGAFVELENGIDGLIHISDMSWSKKIRHPKELLQINQELDVMVLDVNRETRKIALGLKQLESDPWNIIEDQYKVGSMVQGDVLKVLEKGIILQIKDDLEAIVPLSDIPKRDRKKYTRNVKPGDHLELRIDALDKDERKLVLSKDDLTLNEEEKEIAKVISKQATPTQKLEIPQAILDKIESQEAEVAKKSATKKKTEKVVTE